MLLNKHFILGLVAGVLSIISLTFSLLNKPIKFATVNTRMIIAEQAKKLAKEDPKAHTSLIKMRSVADKIEAKIAQWGEVHKVTLLAKPAILSGTLPDYTQTILSSLTKEEGLHHE